MTELVRPLAVALGDPAGIGPEIIVEAWRRRGEERLPPFFVCGGAGVLDAADCPVARINAPDEAFATFPEALPVLGKVDGIYSPGIPDKAGARLALASLKQASALAVRGEAAALVTAPVSKAELGEVGFAHPGQTEFVAEACGVAAQDAVMMLAGPSLKVVPMTVHCPLAEVPGRLSVELIVRRCRIVSEALRRDFALERPRLAIAGLNPHAGEQGRMGREEIEIIEPAIARLRAEGVAATGPHPADTLFAPHKRGDYDIAIAMYHDQALVPLKALHFDEGVNITLGLPIIRTSPDHGTAFDIAGKRSARADAMIAAIRMAGEMATRRGGNL